MIPINPPDIDSSNVEGRILSIFTDMSKTDVKICQFASIVILSVQYCIIRGLCVIIIAIVPLSTGISLSISIDSVSVSRAEVGTSRITIIPIEELAEVREER